ncbi:hypothetical protein EVAR_37654_1 [Eumeta japonica]|uniref:Uncharacterized protein n=1 Tax=Eumeta variegata TaxID=151549 RepID=A0A4C1VPB5_EUMVA|nr:hypothetical protein EVAR_37654_1 [Eumeta japonica]
MSREKNMYNDLTGRWRGVCAAPSVGVYKTKCPWRDSRAACAGDAVFVYKINNFTVNSLRESSVESFSRSFLVRAVRFSSRVFLLQSCSRTSDHGAVFPTTITDGCLFTILWRNRENK